MRPSRDADPTHEAFLRSRPQRFPGYDRTSRYLTMRDGARIAIDVCLPKGVSHERIPTIVRQTRYFRRFEVLSPLRGLLDQGTLDPMNAPMRALFTSRGYAWVDVDVRGSGASFGERPCPWYLEGEVKDGAEIVDWIVQQPWSNGLVGATGVSYDGTTAEFLALTGHPAVKAVAPRFSLFDVYADVAFPGGLHNAWFTYAWEAANEALDRNVPGDMVATVYMLQAHGMLDPRLAKAIDRPLVRRAISQFLTRALKGVAPVDGGREELAAALRTHAENYNVHDGAVDVTFRDDAPKNSPLAGRTSDYFSPHTYVDRLGDVAVLGYGGFVDGAYARANVERHRVLSARGKNSRLLLGPWIHGGQLDLDPDAPGRATQFDHAAELLRFFDRHLEPTLESNQHPDARVRYYLMGAGVWQSASEWPPKGTSTLSFGLDAHGRLTPNPSAEPLELTLRTDVGAGKRSRHRTLLCPFLQADGRGRSPSGYAVFETAPFDESFDLVGSPVLELAVSSTTLDHALVVYLEDDDRLITEGALRTLHRTERLTPMDGPPRVRATFLRADARSGPEATLVIDLLPVAMRIRRGHRLRVSIGAADVDHFTTPAGPSTIHLSVDTTKTRLFLPMTGRLA